MNTYLPKLGDIVWINFNPSIGKEIQKKRPAIVVSSNDYNAATDMIAVCPITSTKNTKPHFIPLSKRNHKKVHGNINPLQVKCFDYTAKEREVSFIERATPKEIGQVAQYINFIFNYDDYIIE